MAKKTDSSKIERIREASVEIIGESGILNCSVAEIARRAGVSVGYLYRHYPGKAELINDLLKDALDTITGRIDALSSETDDIRRIVEGVIGFIVGSAMKNPAKNKFLIMLLNDFSVEIESDTRRRILDIAEKLIGTGQKKNDLRNDISVNDLYIALVGLPMQYLAAGYRFGFGGSDGDERELVRRITDISLKAIL